MIFRDDKGKFFAFVDRFGVGAKLREIPTASGSPAAQLNAAEKVSEYVDVPDIVSLEMAEPYGEQFEVVGE